MDATVRTFDPKEVIFVFGAMTLTAFADGTFIVIKRSGDAFGKKKGADGTVNRINLNNNDFEIEFSTQQTNPQNALLSAQLAIDQATNEGVVNATITDLSGNSLFESPQTWIRVDPQQEYADSLGNRKWIMDTGAAAQLIGGN